MCFRLRAQAVPALEVGRGNIFLPKRFGLGVAFVSWLCRCRGGVPGWGSAGARRAAPCCHTVSIHLCWCRSVSACGRPERCVCSGLCCRCGAVGLDDSSPACSLPSHFKMPSLRFFCLSPFVFHFDSELLFLSLFLSVASSFCKRHLPQPRALPADSGHRRSPWAPAGRNHLIPPSRPPSSPPFCFPPVHLEGAWCCVSVLAVCTTEAAKCDRGNDMRGELGRDMQYCTAISSPLPSFFPFAIPCCWQWRDWRTGWWRVCSHRAPCCLWIWSWDTTASSQVCPTLLWCDENVPTDPRASLVLIWSCEKQRWLLLRTAALMDLFWTLKALLFSGCTSKVGSFSIELHWLVLGLMASFCAYEA